MSKLFDIAYVVAKEEIAFTQYPSLMELEKRHGFAVGQTYATEPKYKEFTVLIGETLRQGVTDELKSSPYFAITDSSVTEKELMYVLLELIEGLMIPHYSACLK